MNKMNKLEILEKVGFDLEKAKAIHQWLNDAASDVYGYIQTLGRFHDDCRNS